MRRAWGLVASLLVLGGCQATPPGAQAQVPPQLPVPGIQMPAGEFEAASQFGDVLERCNSDYVSPVTLVRLIELALRGIEAGGSPLPPNAPAIILAGMRAVQAADGRQAMLVAYSDTVGRLAGGRSDERARLLQIGTRGMVAGLDPHSSLVSLPRPPNQPGAVMGALRGSPGALAGIQAGDVLVELDGQPVRAGNLAAVVEQLRGPLGSTARLVLRRPEVTQPVSVQVIRRLVATRSLSSRVEGGVAIIRPESFNEALVSRMRGVFAAAPLEAGGRLSGLVLDMRGNTGGLLDAAIQSAGLMLPAGTPVVSVRVRKASENQNYVASGGSLPQDVPIVVVVDAGTAAGAELVAATLQRSRALVLGNRTNGSATVQTVMPLKSPLPRSATQDALRLTTGMMVLPGGQSWQRRGVVPDILAPTGRDTSGVTPENRRPGALPAPSGMGRDGGSPGENPWRDRLTALRGQLLPTPAAPTDDFAIAQAIRVVQLLQAP